MEILVGIQGTSDFRNSNEHPYVKPVKPNFSFFTINHNTFKEGRLINH